MVSRNKSQEEKKSEEEKSEYKRSPQEEEAVIRKLGWPMSWPYRQHPQAGLNGLLPSGWNAPVPSAA